MIITSLTTQAQTVTGCVLYTQQGFPMTSSPIYTGTLGSSGSYCGPGTGSQSLYGTSPSTDPLNAICYSPSLPNVGTNKVRNCAVLDLVTLTFSCGIVQTIDIVQCPVDDYAGYMLLSLSVFGIFFIKKKGRL